MKEIGFFEGSSHSTLESSVQSKLRRPVARFLVWPSLLILLLGYFSPAALSQTISPVIVEYHTKPGSKARGSFDVRNNGLSPFNVVLEPMSFSVDREGRPEYRKLDSSVRLRCSAMSFRVAPHQVFTVYYEADAGQLPAWFTVYVTIAVGKVNQEGVQMALRLPHTIYLLSKKKFDRDAVRLLQTQIRPTEKKISLELKNQGDQFARVREIKLESRAGSSTYAGFPFFPGQSRTVELDWDKAASPDQVSLKFANFALKIPFVADRQREPAIGGKNNGIMKGEKYASNP